MTHDDRVLSLLGNCPQSVRDLRYAFPEYQESDLRSMLRRMLLDGRATKSTWGKWSAKA